MELCHGDIIQLVGTDGIVNQQYSYDAFGNEINKDPLDSNPFRYRGEYFDDETGSYYLMARYYNPRTGRFITMDSYGGSASSPMSLNLYTYCHNDPINFIDPSGHREIEGTVITDKDRSNGSTSGSQITKMMQSSGSSSNGLGKLEVGEISDATEENSANNIFQESASFGNLIPNIKEINDEYGPVVAGIGITGTSALFLGGQSSILYANDKDGNWGVFSSEGIIAGTEVNQSVQLIVFQSYNAGSVDDLIGKSSGIFNFGGGYLFYGNYQRTVNYPDKNGKQVIWNSISFGPGNGFEIGAEPIIFTKKIWGNN